jgi:cob(I)alamin adenosyltransferase
MPEYQTLNDAETARLEAAIDDWNESLPPLREFILPGGSRAGATCHLARTVCRRAERALVHLHRNEALRPALLHYVNRLSDVLFVLARVLNREAGTEVTYWQKAE